MAMHREGLGLHRWMVLTLKKSIASVVHAINLTEYQQSYASMKYSRSSTHPEINNKTCMNVNALTPAMKSCLSTPESSFFGIRFFKKLGAILFDVSYDELEGDGREEREETSWELEPYFRRELICKWD